jgi:hypothetical protein
MRASVEPSRTLVLAPLVTYSRLRPLFAALTAPENRVALIKKLDPSILLGELPLMVA